MLYNFIGFGFVVIIIIIIFNRIEKSIKNKSVTFKTITEKIERTNWHLDHHEYYYKQEFGQDIEGYTSVYSFSTQ